MIDAGSSFAFPTTDVESKKTRWRDKLFIVTREPVYLKDKDAYELLKELIEEAS